MTGAETLIKTLEKGGVDVCFANPGTSEMNLLGALDKSERIRSVLVLFEGVASGAADGYARMTDKPATTLVHLGPGFANSLANIHNARRARSPMINIVGNHATYHIKYDTPLTGDIIGLASAANNWVRQSESAESLAGDGAAALAAALTYPGQIATLIVPADHAWGHATDTATIPMIAKPQRVSQRTIDQTAETIRSGKKSALLLGGRALRERGLDAAGRIREKASVRLISETFAPRVQRGAGRVAVDRLPYFGDWIGEDLKDVDNLILVGAPPPTSFFAYKDKPSRASPDSCKVTTLAEPHEDIAAALEALAECLGAANEPAPLQQPNVPGIPSGELDAESIAACVAALLPENAIVSDESATSGLPLHNATQGAAAHDWLNLTGGSIGLGMPLATGAAIACPDRKVINLQADGSAMYTLQALWSQARENLDVTTVIYANHSYAILKYELLQTGIAETAGEIAQSLLSLANPNLDWVKLAGGMGVPAGRATSVATFYQELEKGIGIKGPYLIEATIKPIL